MEAGVAAADESEDVVVPGSGVEEGHEAADAVTDPQPEHLGVEVGHLLWLGGEQQRVSETAGHHVLGGLLPLRHTDPLHAAAHVDQHLRGRTNGRRLHLEQLHGGAVGVAYPQAVFRGARGRLDDGRARPFQRLEDRVQRARAQRERDMVQPLGRRLHQPDLLLVTAWTLGDQRPVLLPGLQAEVLQESLGHGQVRDFQRVVVQP